MKANIFKIERLNTHNGPGFRTVIYFKGCPLHCTWCHNPEGIQRKKQVWVNHTKCIHCGTCIDVCKFGAISVKKGKIFINSKACTGCLECSKACPSAAIEQIGEDKTVEELMKIILQDKFLFESSGGGITVTGGEPGLQLEFVTELFKQCKENKIHTAFDTSGCISPEKLSKVISYTDILFLDLKIFNEQKSIEYTGLKKKQLFDTLHWVKNQDCNPNLNIEFRTPLIPGITDTEENLEALAREILPQFPGTKWELCMFNDLCEDKYQKLNEPWFLTGKKHNANDYGFFQDFRMKHANVPIEITGFIDKNK